MTETVDVFYQEMNYVTLLIFRRSIDACFFYCMFPFIFECLVYFLFITLYYVYDLIINNNSKLKTGRKEAHDTGDRDPFRSQGH